MELNHQQKHIEDGTIKHRNRPYELKGSAVQQFQRELQETLPQFISNNKIFV